MAKKDKKEEVKEVEINYVRDQVASSKLPEDVKAYVLGAI